MTERQLIGLQGHQKTIGDAGEEFVLGYERRRLGGHPRVGDVRIVGCGARCAGADVLGQHSHRRYLQHRLSDRGQDHSGLLYAELHWRA